MKRTFLWVPPKETVMIDATLPGKWRTPKTASGSEDLTPKGGDVHFKYLPA